MKSNTGGPAFPRPIGHGPEGAGSPYCKAQEGMTLRDYFAAAAITGMLNGYMHCTGRGADGAILISTSLAPTAYSVADAMIEARKEATP